mmetsp:Transcript_73486/g.135764  ORF Transcript_73486/g.135764 Transcript_73486/m.135764 type:complete len:1050 (-) Transcript_73486:32-3181(-)
MTLEISGLGFHLNQVVRTAGTEILLHDELMSNADKLVFVVVYAGIFVELAFLVQLIAWYYAWHERRMEKMIVLESQNSSEADTLETAYGPSVQLPSEPVTVQFLKKSMANGGHVALVAMEKENATRYELPYEGLAGKVRENAARFELTYEALASKVNNLAKNLLASGVGHKHIVLLALDRGAQQIAAIYATMLCGAAWVPVDTAVPESRFQELLQDINPSLVVHHEDAIGLRVASWSQDVGVRTATTSDLQVKTTGSDWWLSPISINVKMDDCALVIYTSGTTGKPKGIMYSHAMINHGANAVADLMEMSQESIAFLKTPYMWAVVEWELFPALIRGGRLVVGSANVHKEPKNMADTILAEQVTSLVMAPDVLDLILDVHEQGSQLESLQHVISVGAALPVALANRFTKMSRISAKLHNVYGASESSCTVWTVPQIGVSASWGKRAPVGKPQMGCCAWVLDEDLKKVPTGQTGELCFGGQLALGYFKMPELTAEKFIVHPEFGHIYRTGDLARWRAGVLEICGRRDRQVKISGVRVEPEEVESALRAFRQPKAADPEAVSGFTSLKHVACVATTASSPELVAFVSPTMSDAHVKVLKEYLESKLPRYYLPKYIFPRDSLPLLPNGKVNLRMLVEDADKSVEISSADVVMDSLGQMKSMSRGMILENQVMQRCYSYWMLGVVIDHWYGCGMVPNLKTCGIVASGLEYGHLVRPWVDFALAQIGNYQCMLGFVFFGALQKTRPKPGEEANLRLTLGYEDVFVLVVYLIMGMFDPDWDYNEHRWYLYMVFHAHVCIYIGQRLRLPGWLQVGLGFFFYMTEETINFNPCQRYNLPHWLEYVLDVIFPYSDHRIHHCPLHVGYVMQFEVMYIAAFYYGRRAMNSVTRVISQMGLNTAVWGVVAAGVSMVTGAAWMSFKHFSAFETDPVHSAVKWIVFVVQPGMLALSMVWFPFDMSWWGNAALSTYISHVYFARWFHFHGLHHILKAVHYKHTLLQLLALLFFPMAYCTIVGPFLQYYVVVPLVQAIRRMLDSLSSGRSQDAPAGKALIKGSKI